MRLQLEPERLRSPNGLRRKPLRALPLWTLPSGTVSSASWVASALLTELKRSPMQPIEETPRSPWQIVPETEPWSPPTDAHPDQSLYDFVKAAWLVLEPAVPFVDGWHVRLLCSHLEALSLGTLDAKNLLVNQPPGTTKSLIGSVLWPCWEWTWAPWVRFLTLSYDSALAVRDAVSARRLMQSPWYQSQITEPWDWASDQNIKHSYLNSRTGWRMAMSLTGGITGNHAHRVLVDDPHNVLKGESDAIRETAKTVWREAVPSRVLPGGVRVMIGQRVHEEDCTADWLERERSSIHWIELKEEYEPSEQPICELTGDVHDPRHDDGELLRPTRFPAEKLELRKIELGPYAYSAQYQQSPTPRAGAVLDPSWFPQTPSDLQSESLDLIAAFDLNYSDVETSDWTIGMLAAVERGAILPRIHIIDIFKAHLSDEKHAEAIADWLLLWRPILVSIEKRAFQKQGATIDLIKQIQIHLQTKGSFTATIDGVEADTDKVSRAMIVPGRAKAGLITVDRRSAWWPGLSREMSLFPKSDHDDQVDALAYVVRLAVEKLEKIRAMRNLLGKSARVAYTEAADDPSKDWHRAVAMGMR